MNSIIRIDGPATAHENEYVSLRAVVSPDMSAQNRRRLKWSVTSGTGVKRYEGQAVRHLVASNAQYVDVTVKSREGGELTRRLQIARLTDQSEFLAGLVTVSPEPEKIAPQSYPKNQCPTFSAAVGSGPMLRVGRLFQPLGTPLRRGIFTSHATADARYKADDYADLGFWTRIIEPTVRAEGEGSFTAINTWDRASFTFGLIQFGAHTYGENFHELFRRMLGRYPELVGKYFPEYRLQLVDSRQEIFGRRGGSWFQLTTPAEKTNAALREFIKPVADWVTSSEISLAARLTVVTRLHPELRHLQVELTKENGIAHFRQLHQANAAIDGQPDHICAWVFDIRNQGRGGVAAVKDALSADDPETELRKIGAGQYAKRIKHVDVIIKSYQDNGVFGRKKFNAGTNDFENI